MQKVEDTKKYTTQIPHSPLRFLVYVSKPHKWYAFGALAVVILASALGQGTSYFFKLIVDATEAHNTTAAFMYALLYPVAIFVVQLFYRASGVLGMMWTTESKRLSYNVLTDYLMRHSHRYFSDRFAGSLLSKVSNVVAGSEELIPDILWTQTTAIVSFLVTAAFIWQADVLSAALFIVLVIVLIVVNRRFLPRKKKLSFNSASQASTLRGLIVDVLTNISAARQYVQLNNEGTGIHQQAQRYAEANRANWLFTELMLLVNVFILFAFSIVIFYLLVQRWQAGMITTGDFALILALYAQITGTLLFVGRAFNNMARVLGEVHEGLQEIVTPYEIVDVTGAPALMVQENSQIEWQDVSFEYDQNQVFNHFNLVIEASQRVGLVGASGAGKTTFVSLLLRQHELNDGAILIDGQNIAEVTQDSLREAIAVVPQEPMLFHRSIRENIAYGKSGATDEEIIAVAKKAQAHDFIMTLAEGYDTLVGERGVKLSGGQKQRVAIARAMLKDAPILVLDEATSALDSESEVAIQKALHELMDEKTVIAIAHRLSTLREMDRIIVLDNGVIVEDGTHDTLAKNGGIYQRLWEHQAGGFVGE